MIILTGKRNKNGYVPPIKFHFSGKTAIEDCILKLTEIFFSLDIKSKVEDIIRSDRSKEDIDNEFKQVI